MRKGFTMIELIFVIVILGILAAVAIPKLTATRDDAQVATAISELSMAIRDMGSYYTARGDFNASNLSDMTNVELDGFTSNNLSQTMNYQTTGGDCVQFDLNSSDGNITVQPNASASSDAVCSGITGSTTFTDELNGSHIFGGSSIFN